MIGFEFDFNKIKQLENDYYYNIQLSNIIILIIRYILSNAILKNNLKYKTFLVANGTP